LTSASARSSASSTSTGLSALAPGLALVLDVASSPCRALVLDIAGSPALAPCRALVFNIAGSPALAPGRLLLRSVATLAVAVAVLACACACGRRILPFLAWMTVARSSLSLRSKVCSALPARTKCFFECSQSFCATSCSMSMDRCRADSQPRRAIRTAATRPTISTIRPPH
jgi:hypothetical protein